MLLGGGAFRKCLGHEGGALMRGINAFIEETLSPCKDTARSLQPSPDHAGTLILGFQPPEM